jgi:hypothetical protein
LRVRAVEDEALVAFELEDMLTELGCAVIAPASRQATLDSLIAAS